MSRLPMLKALPCLAILAAAAAPVPAGAEIPGNRITFGMGGGAQHLAALLTFITDVRALGVETAQGLYLASPVCSDLDDRTRAFSARFAQRMRSAKPTMIQAGMYSGVLHYSKAVKQANSVDAPAVMEAMARGAGGGRRFRPRRRCRPGLCRTLAPSLILGCPPSSS